MQAPSRSHIRTGLCAIHLCAALGGHLAWAQPPQPAEPAQTFSGRALPQGTNPTEPAYAKRPPTPALYQVIDTKRPKAQELENRQNMSFLLRSSYLAYQLIETCFEARQSRYTTLFISHEEFAHAKRLMKQTEAAYIQKGARTSDKLWKEASEQMTQKASVYDPKSSLLDAFIGLETRMDGDILASNAYISAWSGLLNAQIRGASNGQIARLYSDASSTSKAESPEKGREFCNLAYRSLEGFAQRAGISLMPTNKPKSFE